MIQLSNVSKRFEDIEALGKSNIHVKKASIYGLLGSNGAGKTTLLKLIAGIYSAETGTVQMDGKNVFENIAVKQGIAFIPDIPYFLPQYTIKQMAEYYKSVYPNWDQERFNKLSKVFQMDTSKKIHRLSKGMQRQVAFWIAFSTKPHVLLLDEPMDGLDPVVRQQVRKLIVDDVAKREMTVVISSHNLKEIEDLCDTIALLHKGKILYERELDDLRTDIHKLQIVFKDGVPSELLAELKPIYQEKRGSVLICIAHGEVEQLISVVEHYLPVIVDVLPLALEEVVVYEMGGVGYAIENIID